MPTKYSDQIKYPDVDAANAQDASGVAVDIVVEDESAVAPTPGAVLQAERERLNLSEKDVSDALHITMHYVRAIESNRFDKLPGTVFTKGYIKSYAKFLGLDINAVAMLFDGTNSEQQGMQQEANRRHMAKRRSDRNKPWVYASIASFILGFSGLWAYNYYAGANDEPKMAPAIQAPAATTIASRPIVQTPAPAAAPMAEPASRSAIIGTSVPAPAPQPTASPPITTQPVTPVIANTAANSVTAAAIPAVNQSAAVVTIAAATPVPAAARVAASRDDNVIAVGADGDDVLRINFSGESWVEVNDSQSRQIYRDIRAAGDVLEITGDAPFSILLGDAPFATMSLNGNEINVSDNIRIDNSARLTVGL